MRRGVTLGAAILRGCAATAFVAGAVAATAAGAGAAAGVATGVAGCWVDTAATVACSGAGAVAAFVRSADESAALLGLDKAASIPMASAIANTEREILQVICRSPCFLRSGQPRRCADGSAASAFGKLSPGNTGAPR